MDNIRENIILEKGILYMDFTASWLWYKPIEEKINEVLKSYANTHSEVWNNATKTTFYYDNARKSLKKSLELDDSFCILPTWTWTTGAIKKFQELMWIYIPPVTRDRYDINPKNVPLVIVWPFEHHSNEISYREWLCDIIRCPLNEQWLMDLKKLEEILEKNKTREIIWSFSAVSNVTWIKNPIKKIYEMIKKYRWIMCIDTASSSAYMNIDCRYFDVMFLSPHKLIWWPWSSWILVIKRDLCMKSDKPTFSWGWVVDYVSRTDQKYYDSIEIKEDVGTPWILQFIRASLAYELRNEAGLDFIKNKEEELKNYFCDSIKDFDWIDIYCYENHDRIPIFSFNIDWFSPQFLSQELSDKYGIQTRAWCSCAGPYGHDLLWIQDWDVDLENKPWWLRIWLHYIHEKEDIDYFVESLRKITKKRSQPLEGNV